MPRIKFTTNPKLPRDWANRSYQKDVEVDVTPDEAERWLRRGVAVIVPSAQAAIARALVTDNPDQKPTIVAESGTVAPPTSPVVAAPVDAPPATRLRPRETITTPTATLRPVVKPVEEQAKTEEAKENEEGKDD